MAHQHYRTKGIVLSKKDSGEGDQIFVLYTCDFGKIEVVGRAIRKIASKLRAGINLFYFIEIEFIQGKNRKTLTDAIVIDKFSQIRKNPEVLDCLCQISQAICALANKEQKEEKIWDLLFETIKSLKIENPSAVSSGPNCCKLKIIFHYFSWNFFKLIGYSPELYNCPVCSSKLLPETFFLSPQSGGVVCWGCLNKAKKENQSFSANEISVETVKLIRFFLKESIEKVKRLNVWEKDLENLNQAFESYFDFLASPV